MLSVRVSASVASPTAVQVLALRSPWRARSTTARAFFTASWPKSQPAMASLDPREQRLDLLERASRPVCLRLLELLAAADLDHVVLVLVDHLLDLVLGQARGRGHGDRLLEAGLEVLAP